MRDGKEKGEWTFQPCSNSSHATMLPTFPIYFPSTSLISQREVSRVMGMSNKAGTDTGNSCTASGQFQQHAPSADLEFHLHGRHGESHPRFVLAVVEAVVSRYISSWWHCCFNQSLSQIPGPTPVLSLRTSWYQRLQSHAGVNRLRCTRVVRWREEGSTAQAATVTKGHICGHVPRGQLLPW